MGKLHLAELRDSWSAWLGVCVAFIVVNFTLALTALAQLAGVRAVQSGTLARFDSTAFAFTPAMNFVFCAVIGAVVIGSSTSLVVDSRRGSLARLALTGATPRQVVSTVMTQLTVVSLACSLIGGALAFVALQPALDFLAVERGDGEVVPAPPAIYALWPVLLASLVAVGLALLGGYKQARRASRIPPVEALRQASGGGRDERMTRSRWLGAGLCLLIIVGAFAAIPAITAVRTKETISNLLQASMVLLIVAAVLLARIAPLVVGPLTRAWTRLVPSFDPSWDLARGTTVAKAARLTKSVVPVMMAIGLLFGLVALGDTLFSSATANGYVFQVGHAGAATLFLFLGLPLLVALAGGVGSLVMMSKQRDAELALSGIVGTTPAQRLAMPVMEGVIITVTGAILSLVMVAVAVGFLAVGFPAADFNFAFSPSLLTFAIAFLVSLSITVAATLLPTLASLRRPEPRVIARLVAE
ncbi:MAG TPA: FtsX-like permease family protein [Propionibacteriaceae bacterium]